MPVSNKESNAKLRQRQLDDPEKRAKLRQREREKYQTKKLKGKVKLVSEISGRENRFKRRQWKQIKETMIKDKYLTTINTPPNHI